MRQVIEQASEVRMVWQAGEFRSEQFNLGPGRRHVEIERNIAAAFDIRRGGVGCPGPYECALADLADDQALAFGLGIGLADSADAEAEMLGEVAMRQQPAAWPQHAAFDIGLPGRSEERRGGTRLLRLGVYQGGHTSKK